MAIDPQRLKALFLAACDIPTQAERAAFLDRECGKDEELRRRVVALLRANDDASGFLAQGHEGQAATIDRVVGEGDCVLPVEAAGSIIGQYRLLQRLGEGGMGAVWVAEQHQAVKRRVALKVIKPGMDSAQVIRRFEAERQALALMDHTNIAKVYDAGATPEGRPYFVMELVPGVPITKYCDELNLPVRERLALFVPVCRAIQHAHQKGVIHRDIKPSNVLVCMQDGKPVPKVIDFGVAKALHQRLTEETVYTELGTMVGTLEYMAPEQAEMSALGVDTRADIYTLGVLLYELLTSTTPLDRKRLRQAPFSEVLRIIKEEEPPRPSTRLSDSNDSLPSVAAQRRTEPRRLMKEVRGELDWIVMKCLEKDRTRRYETADALGKDIERYLADEPVEACPPSSVYRLRKFARKHRAGLAAACAFTLLLVAGAAVSTGLAIRATAAEASARDNEALAVAERDQKEHARRDAEDRAAEARAASEAEKQANQLAKKRLAQIEKANDLLAAIFHDLNPRDLSRRDEDETDPNLRQQLAQRLEEAAAQLNRTVIDDARTLARLQDVLGGTLHDLGRNAPAVGLLRQAYETRKDLLGPDDPETLSSMENLVAAYNGSGQREKARPLAEDCAARSKARFGPDHPRTLASIGILANVYRDTGQPEEAVRLLREIWQIQYAKLPPDDPALLICMHNLGNAYKVAGQLDQAIPILEETLARRKIKHGPDHFATLRTMIALGDCYGRVGRVDQALPLLEKASSKQEAKLGLGHPDVLGSLTRLAAAYEAAGRSDKAIALKEKVLEKQKETLGSDDSKTLALMHNLAVAYQNAGQTEKAAPLFKQVYDKLKQGIGNDQPRTAATGSLDAVRALVEAETRYRQSAADRGPEHSETLEAWHKYAWALGKAGRGLDAALEYRGLLAAGLAAFHDGNKRAEQWAIDYCQFVVNTGYANTEATVSARAILGDDNPRFDKMALAEGRRGLTLLNQGRPAEAEPLLRESLAVRTKIEPDLWQTHYMKSRLGGALLAQKKYADAEPLLKDGYDGMKQREATIPTQHKARVTEALQWLVQLHEATDKKEEATRAYGALGEAFLKQGRFGEAQAATRRCLDSLPQDDPQRQQLTKQLEQCERLLALDKKLPAVLDGKTQLANAQELMELARFAADRRQRYAATARLFVDCLARHPDWYRYAADHPPYFAAAAAVMAASGKRDGADLGAEERTRLRKQGLAWLQEHLAFCEATAAAGQDKERKEIQEHLTYATTDAWFADVRDKAALAKLPEAERESWTKLWADVDAALKKTREKH